jgi:hypothetical protein
MMPVYEETGSGGGRAAELSDMARRATERRTEKKEKESQDKRAAEASARTVAYSASAEVHLVAARAAARKEEKKQQQQQQAPPPVAVTAPEPAAVESYTSPAELRAIAARAGARKQEKLSTQTAVAEEPDSKYANYQPPEPVNADVASMIQRAGASPVAKAKALTCYRDFLTPRVLQLTPCATYPLLVHLSLAHSGAEDESAVRPS